MKYDGTNWTLFTPENSILPCRIINDIFTDKDNNTWVTTWQYQGNGGIVKINDDKWTLFNSENSIIPYNHADKITQDSKGNIWIGITAVIYNKYDVFDGCLLKYNFDGWSIIRPHEYVPKLTNRIISVKVDNLDNVWITTIPESGPPIEKHEIAMFNGKEWIALSDIDSNIYNAYVKDMEFDINNGLWIGHIGYGLTKMNIDYE